jgi:hypothetical protein
MPRYLTVEQVKAYHRNEIPTADDDFIESACDAAEMFLDASCARRFEVAGTAAARVFTPDDLCVLRIHDCTSVTSITNNGSAVTDYQLEPLNGLTWSGETVPYDQVRLLSGFWWMYQREATVSVTATWGWSAIPARITQAALIIAKEIIVNRDEVKLGLVGFSDVGGVVARTNPIVAETIAHYRRVESFGIA